MVPAWLMGASTTAYGLECVAWDLFGGALCLEPVILVVLGTGVLAGPDLHFRICGRLGGRCLYVQLWMASRALQACLVLQGALDGVSPARE